MRYISPYFYYAIIPLLISLYAQFKIKNAYSKYSKIDTRTGVTGAEAARKMLDEHGLTDVSIERVKGTLSDHYAPSQKVLRLSEGVYDSKSIAAVGVACHEAGHAYQHAEKYAPLVLRTTLVPVVNIGSHLGLILFFIGMGLAYYFNSTGSTKIAAVGLIIFSLTAVFSIITLPVEFNASDRAKAWLSDSGLLYQDELDGVSSILKAAAMTYVSAAIQSVANILYYASRLSSASRRNRR